MEFFIWFFGRSRFTVTTHKRLSSSINIHNYVIFKENFDIYIYRDWYVYVLKDTHKYKIINHYIYIDLTNFSFYLITEQPLKCMCKR